VNQLLRDHPYALFVFSNKNQSAWHFLNVKYDEDILTGGGKQELAWYTHFLPHVRGVSYKASTPNPTTGNLATASSWEQKAQDYNIGIMRINTL
jgi:hypothetical protein